MFFAMLLLRSPRYFATIFSDSDSAIPVSLTMMGGSSSLYSRVGHRVGIDRKVDRLVMFQVPDFHRVLVTHEVELVGRIVVPYRVYVGFALRVSGSETERCLAAGQKRVNLRLVHSRSIQHRFVDFESCQDTRGNVLVRTFLFALALLQRSFQSHRNGIDIFVTGLG